MKIANVTQNTVSKLVFNAQSTAKSQMFGQINVYPDVQLITLKKVWNFGQFYSPVAKENIQNDSQSFLFSNSFIIIFI